MPDWPYLAGPPSLYTVSPKRDGTLALGRVIMIMLCRYYGFWPFPAMSVATPLLREDLLAPRSYTVDALADLRASRAKEPGPRGVPRRQALRCQLAGLLARQFPQPMVTPYAHIA